MSFLLAFTVCKATGSSPGVFSTLIDQTIEVAYGEFRALEPTEKKLLNIVMPVDAEDTDEPVELGGIALSDGEYILGIKIGGFSTDNYTVKVYDLNVDGDNNPDTPVAGKPEWPLGADQLAVSFKLDGGSLSGFNPRIVSAGDPVTRPDPDPDKTGFIFEDWYGDEALGTVYDFRSPVNGNISVWAKWTPAAFGIINQPQGRDYGLSEPASALTVTASPSGGITYQWYKSAMLPGSSSAPPDTGDPGEWTAITGATGATLAAGNIGTTNADKGKTYYYVTVTNTVSGGTDTSDAVEIWVKTLAERVADAAGSGSTDSPTAIILYQSELETDGNGFAATSNIGADTHITIVSNDATERMVELNSGTVELSGGGFATRVKNFMFSIAGGGSLTLDGSVTLKGHTGNTKPVVYVHGTGSSLTLGGSAKITGNINTKEGGGVYIAGGGAFTMSGSAEISGNTAGRGGGVCVTDAGSSFTMSGSAKITGNISNKDSGGVYVGANGSFEMSGNAVISANESVGVSGGVLVIDTGTFTMTGGTVYGEADKPYGPLSNVVTDAQANIAASGNVALVGTVTFPNNNGYLGTLGTQSSTADTDDTLYVP
jgi:uncharacterized repeat protein (TIGR02543 family)